MNWRRWLCKWRGYHIAKLPYVQMIVQFGEPPMYVLMNRRCACGAIAQPKLTGSLHPGGMLEYEPAWPFGRTA